MGGFLTKEMILQADDRKLKKVEVPEWGGHVFIRTMTGEERDLFENLCQSNKRGASIDITELRANLLALVIVDPDGKRLFTQKEVKDLNLKNGKVLSDLFEEARKINGIGDDELAELEKN